MDWDPDSPEVVGLAWPVLRKGGVRLDSDVRAAGLLIPSTAAETVDAISLFFRDVVGSGTYSVEVYEAADLPVASGVTTSIFRPTGDAGVSGDWTGVPTDTAGSIYTNIDEATLDTDDYAEVTGSINAGFRFDGGYTAGVGGDAVNSVRVGAVVEHTGAGTASVQGRLVMTTGFDGGVTEVSSADGRMTLSWEWETNPSTDSPWTEAEVQGIDDFGLVDQGGFPTGFRVYQLWMEVDHSADDRVAMAETAISESGWVTFTPDSSWAKADATDYVAIVRRSGGSGSATLVSLDSGNDMPGGMAAYQPTLDRLGLVTALGDDRSEAHACILEVSSAASDDSQPYADRQAVEVHSGVTVTQEITAPATASYRWAQIVARSARMGTPPDEPLVITLGGETLTLHPEEVADSPLTWHILDGTLTADVALTSATQYDLTVTCSADEGCGWEVAVLDAASPPVSGSTAGFGGTTDRGDDGTGEDDDLDVCVVIGQAPTAPADLAATGSAGQIDLTWTATALGADFARYEIEMLHGETWHPIAHIETEATDEYAVYTGRLGVQESFRIRVRHTNGSVSAPSTAVTATATGSKALLASDETGTSTEIELHRPAGVDFPRDRNITPRMGRRYPTVQEAARDRGATIGTTAHITPSDHGLVSAWDDLRDLLDADVTAYALLTTFGERKWVRPVVDGGQFLVPHHVTYPVQLVEVTDTPPVVTVT